MNHVWWRTHLRRLPELRTLGQAAGFNEVDEFLPFLTETLDLPTGGRVLDLGCGRGFFSIRLAQWGFPVTAVEESEALLETAREAAERRRVTVEFRHADPRELPDRSVYSGALLLEFGAQSDADNAGLMRCVAAALQPGGRVVFGACNPYYWALNSRTEHRTVEGTDIIQRNQFDFTDGSLVSRVRCIMPSGERRVLPAARYRAYTLPELRSLVAATGLADLRVYGEDENGRPRPEHPLDNLNTPIFHCVALRPVAGEGGEGI